MVGMKRVKLEFGRELLEKMGVGNLMKGIERLESIAVLKLTPEEYVEVWKVKTGIDLREIAGRFGIAEVLMLREEGDEVTCLVKGRSDLLAEMLDEFDVYYEYPLIYEDGRTTFSIVGDGRQVNRLQDFFKSNGIPCRVLSVSNYAAKGDLLALLTPRQKEVLQAALEAGYFDSPRRKNAREIAAKLGIKHPTFLEHLRKAERKLLEQIL
jgi:DNA-binding CsgD family transcriptional regulator